MENSIHLITKLSSRTRRIGIRILGDNSMLTKELTHNQLNTRQTRRFARLISFFKKPEEQTRSSFHEDRLEKMTWHTRSRVDIGSMIRNR